MCVRCVQEILWWQPVDDITSIREVRKGLSREVKVNLLAEPKSPAEAHGQHRETRFNFSRRVTHFEHAGNGDATQAKSVIQKRSVYLKETNNIG